MEGETRAAQARVESQGWVSGLTAITKEGQTTWEVKVTDDGAAKSQLLRLVLEDNDIHIAEFRRKKYDLEDVFLEIISKEIIAKGQNGR
jgi:hypothetical protein